jgi:hypothetical protein
MNDATRARLFSELDYERLVGTPGEARAIEVITKQLKGMGLAPSLEPFTVTGFTTGTAELYCEGKKWALNPYGLQADCVLEGELCWLENPEIVGFNVGAYRDRIVLAYGSSPRVHELLWEGGVRALVEISAPHREAFSLSHRQKRHADGRAVPSMTARYEDAEALAALNGKKVRIEVRQEVREATGHNIVATVGAPVKDGTLTWLVGHYDTVARSHGAFDNASGVVAMLDVAEGLLRTDPKRELRVVFFSGEELGLRGSYAHVKAHEQEVRDRGRFVVNMDLAGDAIGADVFFVLGTRELLGWAAGVCREDGLVVRENLDIYSSDCMPFSVQEVPSVNIARVDGRSGLYGHTKDDVAANISPAGIENPSRAARALLGRVLSAEVYPIRREIDESLREKIEKYIWYSTLEAPELKWTEKYRR